MRKLGLVLGLWCGVAWAQAPVVTQPLGRDDVNASSSIAVTNTFQSVFAADPQRMGCSIQNKGSNTMYVYAGPIAGATTDLSAMVSAGNTFYCGQSGLVNRKQISVTGTAGDKFWAVEQ